MFHTNSPVPAANVAERRGSPRVELECGCTLSRRFGAPVQGRTVDVGPGGMRVATQRPLSTDEVLEFELPPPVGPGASFNTDGFGQVLSDGLAGLQVDLPGTAIGIGEFVADAQPDVTGTGTAAD